MNETSNSNKINQAIGNAIKEGLQRKGITQQELAEKIGSTQRSISSYVTANTQPPLDILVRICQELELNVNQILGLHEFRDPYGIVNDKEELAYLRLLDGLSATRKISFISVVKRIRDLIEK